MRATAFASTATLSHTLVAAATGNRRMSVTVRTSKYNAATGTWVDAFPPGNAVQIGSIPVSDIAPTLGQILTFNGGSWVAKNPGATVAVGGDLTGTAAAAVVTGIRGVAVGPFAPTAGQALVYDGVSNMYLPQNIVTDPSLYGDLAGTSSAAVVVAINGVAVSGAAPQNNYVLQYSSSNGMWQPAALPSGNPALGGDLSGTASSGTVIKLRGYALSNAVPTSGQVMKYDGSQWAPATPPTFNPTFVGDVSGGVSSMVVTHVQGILVSNAQPQDGQVMKYNASASQWQAQTSSMPWSGITGKPTIPTVVSQLTNDSGYLTSVPAQTWASLTGVPSSFAPSAHAGCHTGNLCPNPDPIVNLPISALAAGDFSAKITSGTYGISVTGSAASATGNAGTVTNGVYTNAANVIQASVAANVPLSLKPFATTGTGHTLDFYNLSNSIASYVDKNGLFTGSGAGLTSATVPIASLVAGNYASVITSGSYSINITGTAAAPTTGTSLGAGTVPLTALYSGDFTAEMTGGGTLNQQLVYNGTNWAAKDDTREFSYVIQDTANDLTTTTGSVATIMTNAQATAWTILAVYCQADSGTPTFGADLHHHQHGVQTASPPPALPARPPSATAR